MSLTITNARYDQDLETVTDAHVAVSITIKNTGTSAQTATVVATEPLVRPYGTGPIIEDVEIPASESITVVGRVWLGLGVDNAPDSLADHLAAESAPRSR